MEPRGGVGDYNAADVCCPLHSPVQRAHPIRADVARVVKVPESKVRVIAGDIGGSFWMKSPVFNVTVLVLLVAKRVGRPVKWMCTRCEVFLCDSDGRDHVTE